MVALSKLGREADPALVLPHIHTMAVGAAGMLWPGRLQGWWHY